MRGGGKCGGERNAHCPERRSPAVQTSEGAREREKEVTLVPFITSPDREPPRQWRNEANQLHRNFLSGMFAWKWHLRVRSSVARG